MSHMSKPLLGPIMAVVLALNVSVAAGGGAVNPVLGHSSTVPTMPYAYTNSKGNTY